MTAALFVRSDNHYAALGADCFDATRDALTWQGGEPGIFHPPCRAWGQLSHFAKPRDGEKELAIWSLHAVRRFGGVLEHPYASRLWQNSTFRRHGQRDDFGGVLIPVYQSWWGHRAPKKSLIYVVGPVPELPEYEPPLMRMSVQRMGVNERERTPPAMATWLFNAATACVGASC